MGGKNVNLSRHIIGADPGFSFIGGRKRLCARTQIASADSSPKSLSAGVQGPLKGPGWSRVVVDALSCYI